LDCYSKFRVALALDHGLDSNLRTAMQQRVNSVSVNPLETSPQKEMRAALQRYDLLRAAASDQNSAFAHRLDKDRRIELARFQASKFQEVRGGIFHFATFGLYTRRAKGGDLVEKLDRYRHVEYFLNFLDSLAAAGTQPEVAYDSVHIQKAVSELTALLPGIESQTTRLHAEHTLERLDSLSLDPELSTQFRVALDSIRQPALVPAGGGKAAVAEGSGTPETLR
jgi:hypothetical protein